MLASLAIAGLGLALGYWVYAKRAELADRWRRMANGTPHRVLANKYYVDELYENSLIKPGYALSRKVLWRWIDCGLIDGLLVNGSAIVVAITGALLRLFQNGLIRFYAYTFAIGVTVFILYLTLTP
jgi:NADH-quinone oxidoreductase subunit L